MQFWGGYFFFDYSVKNQTCRISQREIRRGRCPARRPAEMATAGLPKDSKPHRPVVPGNTALGKTCSTRPAEFARSSLSASGLQTPLFAFSCVCSVGILGVCSGRGFCFYIAFATQKVSSSRGDARQGRGVDLSLLKREM